MARRGDSFQTIRSEGALLPPDLLRHIIDPKGQIPGTAPEDYGLPHGERINETITQSWNRLRRHWAEFTQAAQSLPEGEAGTGLTNDKWNLPLLRELGFGLLPTSAGPEVGGRTYAISRFLGPAAIHLIGCNLSLDRRAAGIRGAAAANPHGLVQEFLNRAEGYLWGIVSNGLRFRMLRDNQALSRQSYLEFDLEAMFAGEVFSDFVLLWLMAHATRFSVHDGGRAETCWLEQWTKLAEEQGTRALESLKGGVEKALEVLGQGFVGHPRNTALRERLRSGTFPLSGFHSQLLRVVYRLIFLFVAEDRTLEGIPVIHPRDDSDTARQARERYTVHYSTARLRELAAHVRGSRHGDLWHQFNLISGTLSGDSRFSAAREHLALPVFGSFLWSAESTTAVNASNLTEDGGTELANVDFLEAIRHLAFTRQGKVLRPVDYKNLGSEELGGVYESLLALTPQISGDGTRFTFAEFAGNERKTSGSYYTPDSLVQCLLDSALDPVVEEVIKGKAGAEAEKAILSLNVCDPAVGSGHFLVGAAHRLALHLARVRAVAQGEGEPSPPIYQHALREVISHCLYGVDVNPMAAELCKVSLWLEAIEPGRPLSFLDHHIRVGNSLLGTTPELMAKGIPDDAFRPVEGDDKRACATLKKRNSAERRGLGPLFAEQDAEILAKLARTAVELEELPDDRLEDVQFKEMVFRDGEETEEYRRRRVLADAWCAAFVIKKYLKEPGREGSASGITQRTLNEIASGAALPATLQADVQRLANQYWFFHWHIAFPEVFASGGFDCVLGNPPWEKINLKDEEFFAESHPDIANAANKAIRKRLLDKLRDDDPGSYARYQAEQDVHNRISMFFRLSGRYPWTGASRINLYSVFCETGLQILTGVGRLGMVIASGIATDDNNKELFFRLIDTNRIVHVWDFENAEGVFPGIHRSYRFALFCSIGESAQEKRADFAFYLHNLTEMIEPQRHFSLSAADFTLMNPISRTCPTFRNKNDVELSKVIYRRVPAWASHELTDEWPGTPKTPFNVSNDSGLFMDEERRGASTEASGDILPVYESKFIHQFNHRYAKFAACSEGTVQEFTASELGNPIATVHTRYCLDKRVLAERYPGRWFLVFRKVARATDERTAIASVIPEYPCVDSLSIVEGLSASKAGFQEAEVNSFVHDYCVRSKVSGANLNHWIWHQLPLLPIGVVKSRCLWHERKRTLNSWLLSRVLELACTAWDIESFAGDCGYDGPPFRWDEGRRFVIRCELDAAFFHLYLGSEEDWSKESENLTKAFPSPRHAVEYIMETFPIVKRRDVATYGVYRTKETILEIYDALANAIRTGQPYQTRLNPPPGPPADDHGNFLPLPEWQPGLPKPTTWPSHIHPPRRCCESYESPESRILADTNKGDQE